MANRKQPEQAPTFGGDLARAASLFMLMALLLLGLLPLLIGKA